MRIWNGIPAALAVALLATGASSCRPMVARAVSPETIVVTEETCGDLKGRAVEKMTCGIYIAALPCAWYQNACVGRSKVPEAARAAAAACAVEKPTTAQPADWR